MQGCRHERIEGLTAPLVSARHLGKRFSDGTLALSDLTFDIRPGEFVSLLGPSGCGKSTALRIVAGLAEATAGTIERQGAEIGFVFQAPTLLPWRTVSGNVALPLRLAGVGRAEARARAMAALASVGLGDAAGAYPRQLSGGMRMRVSIARALVTGPALLLMDEPFAALDEITRQKLNDDVLRLWRHAGLTVLFVTHSVYEAAYLSSRILVMGARPGRIVADLALPDLGPRTASYRTTGAFADLTRTVSERLGAAMPA